MYYDLLTIMYQSAFEYLISLLTTLVAFGSIVVFLLTFFFRLGETYQIFSYQRRKISIYLITKKKKVVPTNKTNHTDRSPAQILPPPPPPSTPCACYAIETSLSHTEKEALSSSKRILDPCVEKM